MQAIKAIYDGISFTPQQPIPVQGRHEVIITFLEPTETIASLIKQPYEATDELDYIEKLCGSLADYPEMTVDKFLERMRADKELEL